MNNESKETKKITIELPQDVLKLCEWGASRRGQTLDELLNEHIHYLAEDFYYEQGIKKLPLKNRTL